MQEQIMRAARSLLDEFGPTFTMEQLEDRAGISRATLYRHVGGKKKLLEELGEERGETFPETDRRTFILKAARAVLGRKGLAATTMEAIADEAGLGVATLYRHFGDKRSLVIAFIEEMTPRPAVRAHTLNPTADLAADLLLIVRTILPFFYENRDIFRLTLMGSERERRLLDRLREGSDSTLVYLSDYFRAQLQAGRLHTAAGPDELALALIGMIWAFAVIGPLHYGTSLGEPAGSGELIVNLFLNDLRDASS